MRPLTVPRRLAALLDQGLVSGSHFVAFLAFARALEPAQWGRFGFAFAVLLFVQGFQRAAVTIPMIPFSADPGRWAATRMRWAEQNASVVGLCFGTLLALAAASLLVGSVWLVDSTLMSVCLLVPMLQMEYFRRHAIQEQQYGLLVCMALLYAAAMLAAAMLAAAWASPWLAVVGMVVGGTAAVATAAMVLRMPPLAKPRWWSVGRDYPGFVTWAGLSHVGFSGYNFGVQSILAALAGPAAVGAFHACRTFTQPVAALIGAMDSIDKPKAASAWVEGGPTKLRQVLVRAALLLLLLGLPYLLVVAGFAESLLQLAYAGRYAGSEPVVMLWCLAALAMMLAQPAESGLYVVRRTRVLFVGRVVAGSISLGLAYLLIGGLGAAGAVLAVATGFTLTVLISAAILWRTGKESKSK